MTEVIQLSEDEQSLPDPQLSGRDLAVLLDVNEKTVGILTKMGVLNPNLENNHSHLARSRGREYSFKILKKAFRAITLRQELGFRNWEQIRPYMTYFPDEGIYETTEWFQVLQRIKDRGLDGTALPGWQKVL